MCSEVLWFVEVWVVLLDWCSWVDGMGFYEFYVGFFNGCSVMGESCWVCLFVWLSEEVCDVVEEFFNWVLEFD